LPQEKLKLTIPDLSKIINSLPEFFQAEKTAGVNATIGFDIKGEKGGQWGVTIANQTCAVKPGLPENADLSLAADSQDLVDVFSGKLSPMKAFFQGKIKMQGNMAHAMKLSEYFHLDNEKLSQLGINIDSI
jgi:putative sterol carrier protein